MNQKTLKLILTILSAVFAVVFLVLLICGIAIDFDYVITRVLMIAAAVFSIALAGELGFLAWFGIKGDKPNYFMILSGNNTDDLLYEIVITYDINCVEGTKPA